MLKSCVLIGQCCSQPLHWLAVAIKKRKRRNCSNLKTMVSSWHSKRKWWFLLACSNLCTARPMWMKMTYRRSHTDVKCSLLKNSKDGLKASIRPVPGLLCQIACSAVSAATIQTARHCRRNCDVRCTIQCDVCLKLWCLESSGTQRALCFPRDVIFRLCSAWN